MLSISPICYLGNPEHLSVPWLKNFCNFGSQNGAIESCLRPGLNANKKTSGISLYGFCPSYFRKEKLKNKSPQ